MSNKEIIFQGFPGIYEIDASELLENLEEIFPQYYMDSDVISSFIFLKKNTGLSLQLQKGYKV